MMMSLRDETLAPMATFAPTNVIPFCKQSRALPAFQSAFDKHVLFRQPQKWTFRSQQIRLLLPSGSVAPHSCMQNELVRPNAVRAQSDRCWFLFGTNESNRSQPLQGEDH